MGHWTASCAVSGLPILSHAECVVVVMTPHERMKPYRNSGVYNLLQRISDWYRDQKRNLRFIDAINKHRAERGEEPISPNEEEEETECPYFLVHKGRYNEYGSLEDLGRDEFGGEHLFISRMIWDFIQTTYPEWIKTQWWYVRRMRDPDYRENSEVETLFAFCMAQRIELTFGPPILGAQDWEKEEYQYKKQFLEMCLAANKQMMLDRCEYFGYEEGEWERE